MWGFTPSAILLLLLVDDVRGHGRLLDPPSRSSMWRAGFDTKPNFEDHEINCGGFHKHQQMGGRCGVCGDPVDGRRDNELCGDYNPLPIRSKWYHPADVIEAKIEITANHMGYFEFHLCDHDRFRRESRSCFDALPLQIAHSNGETRFWVPEVVGNGGVVVVQLQLPRITCQFCILKWHWVAGNNWGQNGQDSCLGCGPQEHFYGCADVAIIPSNAEMPEFSYTADGPCRRNHRKNVKFRNAPYAKVPAFPRKSHHLQYTRNQKWKTCVAQEPWAKSVLNQVLDSPYDFDGWCDTVCKHSSPWCPPLCKCTD